MEDDVCYSTLEFNTSYPAVPKDVAKTENAVYSEIRTTREKTSTSSPAMAGKISAICEEEAAPRYTSCRQATAALGLLCVLLLAGLTTMCVLNIKQVSKYSSILALYTNESTAHRILQADKAALETEKKELTAQRDQFKNTLRIITQYSNLPADKYCTITNDEVHCEPCMKNWIQNGSSCYLFYMSKPWLTWTDSRGYCAERGGHLVVIDTLEEQEFISQHIPFYYDIYHGYWIGLVKQYNMWVWTTGAELQSNVFWAAPPENSQTSCVLSKPISADLNNWEEKMCVMHNRFICEMKATV
ncbi:C-type lectin domain family 9 member A [Pangasianodon hypophthalmus]|uniref:C-type lectin domain family 9 member A n=1 Tax=Pangasianodon hypophthalmus TaxID=310915 RepID=UPI002306E6A8|nr:C-type lectin domain family 9 member A [Pangasianodon hypophthalmus]